MTSDEQNSNEAADQETSPTKEPIKRESLIGFGSNLGRRHEFLATAMDALLGVDGLLSLVASDPVTTKAIGGPDNQPNYVNAVFRVTTTLSADELHQVLLEIESQLGRERRERWGARNVDLDLLLHGDERVCQSHLSIPHPRMTFRRFVLEPAMEIGADMLHPLSGQTIKQLLDRINDLDSTITIAATTKTLEAWQQLVDQLEAGNCVSIETIETPDSTKIDAAKTKVLIYDLDEFNNLDPAAIEKLLTCFPGPTLNLTAQNTEEKQREISAAISSVTK